MRILVILFMFATQLLSAQPYWQQRVEYKIDVDFDHTKHQFTGNEELTYYNNSPDTLQKVFFHLYYNAFQPGSMMDVRSRTLPDPDRRVGSRIAQLKDDEIGYHKIESLTCDGKKLDYEVNETILEVTLPKKGIRPGKKAVFKMKFNSQVPVQIRRTGRKNSEDIDYSMTQWYPKIAEYDKDGWSSNPYIGREFHGVWGDYDVTIRMDSNFTIAGTGYLQNPEEIGKGYLKPGQTLKSRKEILEWKFKATDVHDFAWAADRNYAHDIKVADGGIEIHFFYNNDTLQQNWDSLQDYAVECMNFMNKTFGRYPYKKYSVIQGGDGGMEYPMATLITAHSSMAGLISVTVHEMIHSWYQGALATNESKYAWVDEGFTTFAQYITLDHLYKKRAVNPLSRSYRSYFYLANSNKQEPMTTHADHYLTNTAYGINSYSKGAVFLMQLNYIIGNEAFFRGMKRYHSEWKLKHPTPDDFKRVMEKESGLELDWYFEQFIGTTNKIDYGIKSVISKDEATEITLTRVEDMPMPLDVKVTFSDSSEVVYNIPLRIMRGAKNEDKKFHKKLVLLEDWPWTHPYYVFRIKKSIKDILSIEIDPSERLADINREDNFYPYDKSKAYEMLNTK